MLRLQKDSNEFSQGLIDEHRKKEEISYPHDEGKCKTFIDAMLSLQESEPEYYSDDIIKGIILVCFHLEALVCISIHVISLC